MRLHLGAVVLVACALAACQPTPPPAPAVAAPPAGPPPLAGVIAGALGEKLSDADRQTAFDAQVDALDKGQRKSWKGKGAVYGFIDPAPEAGGCRDYTHTVYYDGRPQTAKGNACRQPNGAWKF